MASKTLSLSHPELLAEYVPESEFKAFFEKRLATPPDHMAMLIRNGEIVDTYKGAHFSVGGIVKRLKSLVVGSSHISILLADLKPFSLQSNFSAITKDNVEIRATATFELQVNPDKPANVMGLVNTSGYLTHDEVLKRFKPHLTDRVIEAAVRRVDAGSLRGERGLQDHIQAEIMREIQRVAGDLGLIVRAVSLEWALNATEKAALEKATLDREQIRLDNELEYLRRKFERGTESTKFKIAADFEVAKFGALTDNEFEKLIFDQEVQFTDARQDVERRRELEAIEHQLQVMREQRIGRFENKIAELDHAVDMAKRKQQISKLHQDLDRLQQIHLAEMKKLKAFTDLEIRKRSEFLELELTQRTQQQQLAHLKAIRALENADDDADEKRRNTRKQVDAKIEADRVRAETEARVAQLKAGANMTPEQILAINAGLSADVANVLVEQARANANGSEQVMSVMREMVAQASDARVDSERQAREMFRMGMEGTVGVAQGAGPGSGNSNSPTSAEQQTVECHQCGRENNITNRCCIGCGKQLRT